MTVRVAWHYMGSSLGTGKMMNGKQHGLRGRTMFARRWLYCPESSRQSRHEVAHTLSADMNANQLSVDKQGRRDSQVQGRDWHVDDGRREMAVNPIVPFDPLVPPLHSNPSSPPDANDQTGGWFVKCRRWSLRMRPCRNPSHSPSRV